jgi:hypothetical protein
MGAGLSIVSKTVRARLVGPAKPVGESLRVFPATHWLVAPEPQNAPAESVGVWRAFEAGRLEGVYLIPNSLMIGHHFSAPAFTRAPSAFGVC